MPSKSPGFTYYPKDLIADTATMSAEEVGVYWLLVSFAWVGLPGVAGQCRLPDDDRQLAILARLPLKEWRAMRERILSLFQRDPVTEGQLVHGRLLKELAIQQARSKTARNNVKKRWRPGTGGDTTNESPDVPEPYRADTAVSDSYRSGTTPAGALKADANEDADEDVVSKIEDGPPPSLASSPPAAVQPPKSWPPAPSPEELVELTECDAFLAAYPFPGNVPDAQHAWHETRLIRPPIEELKLIVAAWAASPKWREQNGKFIPGAAKWLRGQGWKSRPGPRGDGFEPANLALLDPDRPSPLIRRLEEAKRTPAEVST